jgi:hypothetical protein
MFASTNVFVTAAPLAFCPSVVRVTSTDAGFAPGSGLSKCQIDVAFTVTTPGTLLFTVTVQVAVFPASTGLAHVSDCVRDAAGIAEVTVGVTEDSVAWVPEGTAVVVIVNTC